jgi:hypothetical protein
MSSNGHSSRSGSNSGGGPPLPRLLSCRFNQEQTCIAVATSAGFRILNCDPFSKCYEFSQFCATKRGRSLRTGNWPSAALLLDSHQQLFLFCRLSVFSRVLCILLLADLYFFSPRFATHCPPPSSSI